jgi:hypothetical protein
MLCTLTLLALIAFPAMASDVPITLTQAALDLAPKVVLGTHTNDLAGARLKDFAMADTTVGGDEEYLRYWIRQELSDVIANELVSSYARESTQSTHLETHASASVRLLPLEKYRIEGTSYDWVRLKADYPGVRGIVTMSSPALDSQGAYAIVHYQVITASGLQFANFHLFARDGSTSWRNTIGVTGALTIPQSERALPRTQRTGHE